MNEAIRTLTEEAERCRQAAKSLAAEPVQHALAAIEEAIETVGRYWSGSFLISKTHFFQVELLSNQAPRQRRRDPIDELRDRDLEDFEELSLAEVKAIVLAKAEVESDQCVRDPFLQVTGAFDIARATVLPLLDALLQERDYAPLREVRDKINKLHSCISQSTFASEMMPRSHAVSPFSADRRVQIPHHYAFQAWIKQVQSAEVRSQKLVEHLDYCVRFLQHRSSTKGELSVPKGKIFIGHGRSLVWLQLKDFLTTKLGLEIEEYNAISTAGKSRQSRLLDMLNSSSFAFLVCTGEDAHANESVHARENVIHEAGLFQGRHGFHRAIIVLEEGCEEFSNIHGLDQIRFPKGKLSAAFEDVRDVLKRENLIS